MSKLWNAVARYLKEYQRYKAGTEESRTPMRVARAAMAEALTLPALCDWMTFDDVMALDLKELTYFWVCSGPSAVIVAVAPSYYHDRDRFPFVGRDGISYDCPGHHKERFYGPLERPQS